MTRANKQNSGFTLLEIMVVVAIIAIMAGSVSIGFSSFGKTIQLQETSGVITDRIKALELETIRRDYRKNIINFEENFLVVESEVVDDGLDLDYKGVGALGCNENEVALGMNNVSETIQLAKRDEQGNNIGKLLTFNTDSTVCVDFLNSAEDEWQYQLFSAEKKSNEIRLIHFNLKREQGSELPKIIEGTEFTLTISAPYSKKEFYKSGNKETGKVELTLQIEEDGESETVQLQGEQD